MLTRVVSATLPRTSCWARVVRLIPEILQISAVLAVGSNAMKPELKRLGG